MAVAALSGCASLPAATPAPGFSAAADRGMALAQRRCSGCHMVGLDETAATDGPRFRDLRMRYNALSLQRRFAAISAHGTGEMPPVEFSAAEAEDLIAYFESLDRRY
jgi:mono/diheme cytochrome c family protein